MLREAGDRLRGRARHHRRRGRARLRRHPRHPPRPGQRRRVRHRPRGPGQAGDRARLAGARRLPRHARLLHGRARAAADRRAADRQRPPRQTSRSRWSSSGTLPGQRTLAATLADVAERAKAERHPRARDHARRARRRAARAARVARAPPAARPHDRRHARAGAGQRARRPAARARRRRSSRRPPSASSRCPPRSPTSPATTSSRSPRPTAPSASWRCCATPASWPGSPSPRSAPAPRARCASAASSPTWCPERAVAEGLVEALRDVPVTRALIARAAEGRDVLPDALRERGAEVDLLALYETVAEPLDDETRAAAAGAGLPAVHLGLVGALLRAARARHARGPATGLDRPGHQRGAARARRRAGPRGRPAHARRPGRGAPQRRELARSASSTARVDGRAASRRARGGVDRPLRSGHLARLHAGARVAQGGPGAASPRAARAKRESPPTRLRAVRIAASTSPARGHLAARDRLTRHREQSAWSPGSDRQRGERSSLVTGASAPAGPGRAAARLARARSEPPRWWRHSSPSTTPEVARAPSWLHVAVEAEVQLTARAAGSRTGRRRRTRSRSQCLTAERDRQSFASR